MLLESTSIIILILTKDHNAIIFYHVTCFEVILIGHLFAIDVGVPGSSGVLPRCADVMPMVIIGRYSYSSEDSEKTTETTNDEIVNCKKRIEKENESVKTDGQ